jgi:hypothetical protein
VSCLHSLNADPETGLDLGGLLSGAGNLFACMVDEERLDDDNPPLDDDSSPLDGDSPPLDRVSSAHSPEFRTRVMHKGPSWDI